MAITKRELLKALRRVAVGEKIIVQGNRRKITEVVEYREDGDKWLNLVWHNNKGEVALEIEGNKLTLWEEMRTRPFVKNLYENLETHILESPKTITYLDEEYQLEENGSARTTSKTQGKVIIRDKTRYWVYKAKSGHAVAVEIWDDVVFYYSNGELPASAVQVI